MRWAPTPSCSPATVSIPTTASACAPRREASSHARRRPRPTPPRRCRRSARPVSRSGHHARRRNIAGRRRPDGADGMAVRAGGPRLGRRAGRAGRPTGCESRCPAAPRASTSLRRRRSACIRARGRTVARCASRRLTCTAGQHPPSRLYSAAIQARSRVCQSAFIESARRSMNGSSLQRCDDGLRVNALANRLRHRGAGSADWTRTARVRTSSTALRRARCRPAPVSVPKGRACSCGNASTQELLSPRVRANEHPPSVAHRTQRRATADQRPVTLATAGYDELASVNEQRTNPFVAP